jgi:hypothetical protein
MAEVDMAGVVFPQVGRVAVTVRVVIPETARTAVSRQAALAPAIHRIALPTVTLRASRRAVIPPATQALPLLRQ